MRFLQSVLQDARRPVGPRIPSVRRSPIESGDSPAPPLEEQDDGAMTLYRFQKEGAANPRQVSERGQALDTSFAAADLPLPNRSQQEPLSRQTEARPGPQRFAEQESDSSFLADSDFDWIQSTDSDAKSAADREVIVGGNLSGSSTADVGSAPFIGVSAFSDTVEKESLSLKNKSIDTVDNQDDLTTEVEEPKTVNSPKTSMSSRSARRNPGADTPSEYYPEPSAGHVDHQSAEHGHKFQSSPAKGSTEEPFTQTIETPEPVAATRHTEHASEATQSEPSSGVSPAGPKVQIGQVDVVVVKQGRSSPRASDRALSSRQQLSRNYLRRL